MASTSETSVEMEGFSPTTIPEQDDTGQNSETQLTTACVQEQPTLSSPTTSQESEPKKPEPPNSSAFYKKTYTSGTIRFIEDDFERRYAKFIKINADAGDNESILQQVAEGVANKLWRLRHKNLLLSVTSGADELDEAGRNAFKEGIEKMLPGTCMVTGGTNDGVTRLVGDAVLKFNNRLSYKDKCPTIGIVCLDRLRNKDTIKHWELTRGVFGIDSDGELFTVDKSGERWTLNPASLTKGNVQSDGNTTTSPLYGDVYGNSSSPRFAVGDLVQIRNEPAPEIVQDHPKETIGKIGSIVEVDEDTLRIHVYGYWLWYQQEAVTLFTGERFIDILKTHFEIYEPSDKNDKLVEAVMRGDAKDVYAIIHQAYKDFRESTSASFGVDGSSNFFVVDANGDRRTFIPDELNKDGITNAIECKAVDTPDELARGDLVRILPTATSSYLYDDEMFPTLGKVGTIVKVNKCDVLEINVCGNVDVFSREDVALVNRGYFDLLKDLLKEHFKNHKAAYGRDELQQAVIKDDFEEVTAIIRKAYKDIERVCEYELSTTIDDLQDNENKERYLNPHHHLFVLVEDSTLNKFGGEIEFRAILENRISSEMLRSRIKANKPYRLAQRDDDDDGSEFDFFGITKAPENAGTSDGEIYQDIAVIHVPHVKLVLNNDQYTLETVKTAMKNDIPSVVVITTDSDTHKRQDSGIVDRKNAIKMKMLRNSNIPNDAINRFQETYQHKINLLAVINLSDMPKLLAEMTLDVCWEVSSVKTNLLKWALDDHKEDDVIKRLVCADGNRTGRSNDIAWNINYFLSRNDVEVVGALVRLNVDMNSAWIEAWQYKEFCDDKVGLPELFKSKAKHTVLWVMQRVKERPVRGTYHGRTDLRPATYDLRFATYAHEKQLTEDILPYWEYMFIWALLLRKHDIAKILWTKTEHPIFMALIAHNLFEAVKMQVDDKVLIAEMEKYLSEWSTVAIDCLNECYQKSEEATYIYLTMTMPFWYTQSCLDLAVESSNMKFLTQPACYNLFGDVWNGNVFDTSCQLHTNRIKFFINKMQAPKTKFAYNVISYLVFLSLFAYVLLFDLPNNVSTKEFVLLTWVLTILVEEIRQRIRTLKKYFSDGWNWIDMFTIVLFLLGFGLRFKQSRDTFDWPRVVLAIDYVAFVFRLVHIFYIHKNLGPKLIIIQEMLRDLMYFGGIMAVLVLAYAIASHSILYPDAPLAWKTAIQIIRKPYLHFYGELDETEDSTDCTNDASLWTNGTSQRCPSETGKTVGPIMTGVYLLFSNIVLLNLLIAMFSYTFTTLQSNKDWCVYKYLIIKDYALRPVLCPPLNVFWLIYQLFQCCRRHTRTTHDPYDDPFHTPYEGTTRRKYINGEWITASYFMQSAASTYAHNRKRNEAEKDESRIKTANEKLDNLAEREDEFRRLVLDQLKEMKESINNLHRKMADSEHKADEITEPLCKHDTLRVKSIETRL